MTPEKRTLRKRIASVVLIVFVCGYATFLLALNRAMHSPPEQFGRFMSKLPMAVFLVAPFETMWTHARAGQINLGEQAPAFSLSTLDKTAHVQLADLRGKPVVLVFGSYT